MGAGRRFKQPMLVHKTLAEQIFPDSAETRVWQKLLRSRNERIVLSAAIYLTDRKRGKAPQSILTKDVTDRPPLLPEYIRAINTALGVGKLVPITSEPTQDADQQDTSKDDRILPN